MNKYILFFSTLLAMFIFMPSSILYASPQVTCNLTLDYDDHIEKSSDFGVTTLKCLENAFLKGCKSICKNLKKNDSACNIKCIDKSLLVSAVCSTVSNTTCKLSAEKARSLAKHTEFATSRPDGLIFTTHVLKRSPLLDPNKTTRNSKFVKGRSFILTEREWTPRRSARAPLLNADSTRTPSQNNEDSKK